MLAAGLVKGLLGGSGKKVGGALVKTKDKKIQKVVKEQVKTENKPSFTSVSESVYKTVAQQKKITAGTFKPETDEAKVDSKVSNESLKTQLDNLIENTSKLDNVFKQQLKEDTQNSKKKDAALAKQRAERRERKLETTPKKKLIGGVKLGSGPMNLMDMIGKFLLNTLLGGLALLTLNNLPKITNFLKKYGQNLYLIFNGIRLGLFGLKKFLGGVLKLSGSIFKSGLKATGKFIKSSAKLLGKGIKGGFVKLGDAIIDFARGAINTIRRLAGKPPLPPRPGKPGGRNAAKPGTRLKPKQRTATASKAARKRYAKRYGPEAAKRRFQGNVQKPTGQATKLPKPRNKFLTKLFGPKTAGEIKQASPVLKKVSKATKGIRIPIVGPILVAISSMLADDPPKKTMFKAVGTGLGEALGTLIPIPVIGTIVGGLIGEYGGDLLYTLLEGGGLSGVKNKMAQDWNNTLKTGSKFKDYIGQSFNRYNESLPKVEIPDLPDWLSRASFGLLDKIPFWGKDIPDPKFFLDPRNIPKNIGLMKNALFPPKGIVPETGEVDDLDMDLSDAPPPPELPPSPGSATSSATVISSGKGSDFWTLVAVASLEDGDPQGRADVAQSIYNRAASGAYSSKNIRELIIADGQYQPTWDYPRKNPRGKKANPEWFSIVDAQTAAAAAGKSIAFMEQAAREIMNPSLQKKAKDFVGGRTDFTNYSKTRRRGQIYRETGGRNNYFGWDWNYSGNVVGRIPQFDAAQPTTQQSTQARAAEIVRRVPAGQKILVDKVPFSDFSRSKAQGGTGKVGVSSGYRSAERPNHSGIDIGTQGQKGYYVSLKANGKVTVNQFGSKAGHMLFIQVGDIEYVFMHLARKSSLNVGDSYVAGTPIGEIGNTGRSFGEHLHFEVRPAGGGAGTGIDPTPYLKMLEIGKLGTSDGTTTTARIAAPTKTSTSMSAARVSQSGSYDRNSTLQVPVPMPSSGSQGQKVIKQKDIGNMEASLIDVVNSYHTAQLLANLYKQG